MEDLEALRRTYAPVAAFPDFRADQRIWWIYLRNAAIEVASWANLPDLQAACDAVKAFPENLPNERLRWLELRQAVEKVLAEG